jgi:hypothetical protein
MLTKWLVTHSRVLLIYSPESPQKITAFQGQPTPSSQHVGELMTTAQSLEVNDT